jgi:hypothetical protein
MGSHTLVPAATPSFASIRNRHAQPTLAARKKQETGAGVRPITGTEGAWLEAGEDVTMPEFFCGNCGNLAKSLNNCGHCNGPVFDLSTPQGAIDCRTYRSIRLELAQVVPRFWYAELAGLVSLVMVAFGSWVAEFSRLAWWATIGLSFVFIHCVLRWARSRPERRLDERIERPDPFHDPRAPEPRRITGDPASGAAS